MKRITEDIKSGQFARAYLLYGPEAYLRAQYKERLLKALVPGADDMNFTRFAGRDLDEGAIISQAETLPFFADRRVILVEDSGFFKNKADRLADYAKNLPDYLVLIFAEEAVDKRSRLYKAVQKAGRAVEFAAQTEETLTRWVLQRLSREGKKITRDTMHRFLAMTGTDMANIDSELEKLLGYTAGRDVVTTADVEAIGAPQVTNQIFDMVRAVTEHNSRKALALYDDLLALNEPPMRILYLLARQFNQLLLIKSLAHSGLPNKEIAAKAGVPPFVVSRSLGLVRGYTERQLADAVRDITGMEEAVKTGRLADRVSVEMVLVKYSR